MKRDAADTMAPLPAVAGSESVNWRHSRARRVEGGYGAPVWMMIEALGRMNWTEVAHYSEINNINIHMECMVAQLLEQFDIPYDTLIAHAETTAKGSGTYLGTGAQVHHRVVPGKVVDRN